MSNLVIGIEGLVGAGKTSICREMIKRIPNTILLNGGNIYRSIIGTIMQNGEKLQSIKSNAQNLDMKKMMDLLNLEFKIENNETVMYCNGKKIDETGKASIYAKQSDGTYAYEDQYCFPVAIVRYLQRT